MGRRAKIWQREDRAGYFTTVNGKQVFLSLDEEEAKRKFHLLKGGKQTDDCTVSELAQRYLAQLTGKPNTVRTKTFFCELFVQHVGKSKKVSEVTTTDIERWYRPTWNSSSRNSALRAILVMLRWGVAAEMCERREVLFRMKQPRMGTRKPLTGDEIKLVLEKSPPAIRDFAIVLLTSGARPGELREAQIEDYADGVITREEHKTADKTGQDRRIYLTNESRKIVEKLIGKRKKGHIFLNSLKRPWRQQAMGKALARIGTGIGAYRLRHTFCSSAINGGMDSVLVAKLLGHTNPLTLYKHYWKPDDQVMKDAAEKAAKLRK